VFSDDIMDSFDSNYWPEGEPETNEMSWLIQRFSGIIQGYEDIISDEKDLPTFCNKFPRFLSVCKLLQEVRNAALVYEEKQGKEGKVKYFLTTFSEGFEACAVENKLWGPEMAFNPSKDIKLFTQLKERSIGVIPCIEMIYVIRNIKLKEWIRRDNTFYRFLHCIAKFNSYHNDLISIKKEIFNGERSNYIIVHDMEKFQRATDGDQVDFCPFQRCQKNLLDTFDEVLMYGNHLLRKFPHIRDLEEYIHFATRWSDGLLRWEFLQGRYANFDWAIEIVV
jgi:hypothetical protein